MLEKFLIYTKTIDHIVWLFPVINTFPKAQRFVLGQQLETCALRFLEQVIRANNQTTKVERLAAVEETLLSGNFTLSGSYLESEVNLGGGGLISPLAKTKLTLDTSTDTVHILGDTVIGGSLTIGLITVDDLNASINSLGETLKIQNQALADVEFMGGKLLITRDGSLITQGEIVAAKVTAGSVSILGAGRTIGSGSIPTEELSVMISAPTLSSSLDKVFLTATSKTNGQMLILSDKQPGKGFVVSVEKPITTPITFDWWVVQEK